MLDRLITFALQQRVFVLLLTAALVGFGWVALSNLPIEAFPDVQDVQVQIVTQALGQAPEEVERTVTLPIEREMSGVPRMTNLRSVSITGLSVVTLTFADQTDDYFARQQVLERLQTVSLPPNAQPVLAPLSTAVGEIFRYMIAAPAGMSLNEVRALQDWTIKPALRITPGIADVVSFGGTIKEYQVRINPYLLKKYAIPIEQVNTALANSSNTSGGGLLRRGEESLVIRGIGLFRNLDDIGQVAVASRNGRPILVSDVAEKVVVGARPRSGIVAYDDRDDIVEGIVQMTKGGNAAKVVAAVNARVDEINARLPPGVRIVPFYERTDLIRHTVKTVAENLLLGAALVIAILIVFLRNWRAALIVASVIPLSLLFAFILMDARGVSANLISLGAIDFGIIVDSAVVLVEGLMVKLAAGQRERNAHGGVAWRMHTLKTTAVDLGHPILFSKAIIILAFMPIFTFQRVEGKIFAPMAYTLSFALLGAILLTLTLVPTLLSYAMKGETMFEKESRWLAALQERYRRALAWSMKRRAGVVAASVLALGAALGAAPYLGTEFLPKLDEGNIWLTIALPPSTALDQTKDVEREVRRILRGYPEVRQVVSQVGRPDDGTDPKGPNNLEILADLGARSGWRFADKDELVEDMSSRIRGIPGVPTNFSQVIQDNVEEALSGAKGEIVVKVFGPDLEILQAKADQIAQILAGVRGAADVGAFRIGGQSEVALTIDRARLGRYGISVNDVNAVIQAALAPTPVNTFYERDRRFDVTLRLDDRYRDAVDDLANLQVSLPNGAGTIALGDIADVEVRQGAFRIARERGGRNATVKENLVGRDQGSFVAEAQRKVDEQLHLPPGYYVTWGGQFENQQRAMKRLQIIVPISLLLIFSLLFWAFKSVSRAFLVLLMIPFTLVGGVAGLAIAGLHLSVSAAVGFIAVAGISVQNGVIMVEQIAHFLREGRDELASIVEGAVLRLRPIVMTALMAGLGLLPAALSHGIGSETQRPFAVVIVGGIVSATVFTLLLLPILFHFFTGAEGAHRAAR